MNTDAQEWQPDDTRDGAAESSGGLTASDSGSACQPKDSGLSEFVSGYLEEMPAVRPAAPRASRVDVSVGAGRGGFWSNIFPVTISGVTKHDVAVRQGFFGGLKLLVDGEKAERGSRRNSHLVPTDTNASDEFGLVGFVEGFRKPKLKVVLNSGRAGSDPRISTATTSAAIGRRVAGGEWLWVSLPLAHVMWNILDGGALGVLAGGFAFLANVRIFTDDGGTVAGRYVRSLVTMIALLASSLLLSLAIVVLLA